MSPVGELLAKLALGLALIAGCIWGWNHYTDSLVARGDAAGYKRAQDEYTARELFAVKKAREEERAKTLAAEKEAAHARTELAAIRGSFDAAVDAGRRLRKQLAAIRRRPAASNPAAASRGKATDPAEGVLAELRRSTDAAEEAVARYADEARIAGRTCERLYDEMRGKP